VASIDDVIASAKRRTETVRVCLREDLYAEHRRLVSELDRLEHGDAGDDQVVAAAEAVQAVEADIAAASVDFVFAGIGRGAWTRLLDEHPPTAEQRADSPRLDHNPDTFPYAAIAASLIAPEGVTAEKVAELEEHASVAVWNRLWGAALLVNVGGGHQGESEAASAALRRLRPRSEQPSDSASADPSSSDES
jgi:hypothetical protein